MKRRVMVAALCALATGIDAHAQFAPPTGIYSLGRGRDLTGTQGDDRIDNLRDYEFLSGFTLRLWWRDLEPTEGVYDLGVISEAFQAVAPLGQRINLEILDEPPDYVIEGASATYTDHRDQTRPVPWDAFGRQRRAALQQALSFYTVDDGQGLLLHQHPTLAAVSVEPMGLNYGVRDLNGGLTSHPEYTREKFVDAVVDGVAANLALFPYHEGSLLFFGFNDDEPGISADDELIERLDAQYNGPGQPRLALFVENLSDVGPNPQANGAGTGANLLDWTERGGRTMMQALDSWLSPNEGREEQTASNNPATGVRLGYNQYGTDFYELYLFDLDAAAEGAVDAAGRPLADDLTAWNTLLTSSAPLVGDYNGDGAVDTADYLVWREGRPAADGNLDGVVDRRDYVLWEIALGGASAAAVAAPEGGGAALAGVAALLAMGRRRIVQSSRESVAPRPESGMLTA